MREKEPLQGREAQAIARIVGWLASGAEAMTVAQWPWSV